MVLFEDSENTLSKQELQEVLWRQVIWSPPEVPSNLSSVSGKTAYVAIRIFEYEIVCAPSKVLITNARTPLNRTPSSNTNNEMRHSSVIISFIFLVNCLSTLQGVHGKNDKRASKRGESEAFLRSGLFSTKHKHECTWEIVGDANVSLSLSCSQPSSSSYNCTYEGEPQQCPLYATKAKQYWKQILGKFKKMKNACEDNTLKSRLCKKAEATKSQLVKIGGDVLVETEKGKVKGKGHIKEPEKGPEGRPRDPEVNANVGTEKKPSSRKKKPDTKSSQTPNPSNSPAGPELTTAREVNDDIVELNENLSEAYCAEKWHSVCSFFVNFWNG
ncbi:LOW QUALITY PROTEIN: fibroblast growth factor-binding protein 3 [Mixophyes fleayi]|uniref:LOW QUALITY PROTEIN: fibroblast growth factor-binding protein 3 n=1 Tax=Mixophyes fleayi TaxID=3061075 RepID=UPI003F4E13F7